MTDQPVDPRLLALSNLVQVEADARRAETLDDLAYVIVNDTRRLVAYRQAFLWQETGAGGFSLKHASNTSAIDKDAPLVQWLESLPGRVLPDLIDTDGFSCDGSAVDGEDAKVWNSNLAANLHAVPVTAPSGHQLGILVFFSDSVFSEAERALIERLVQAYGHAWQALQGSATPNWLANHVRQFWVRYAIAAGMLLLLPVRLYVLAPAQVSAEQPVLVTAPMSGVIESVEIPANAAVEAGDVLFNLEDTRLRNELAVSEKALSVAQAEYLKNAQNAMFCDNCRSLLPELRAVLEREQAKVDWARSQLERATVRAEAAGIAVFTGRNELEGQPVSVGQRVMTIAEPEQTELSITVPIDDAISIDQDTSVVFYLNVDPLKSYDADIYQSSYEAVPQPDGTVGYIVRARFDGDRPRLGLRGTAKVYGKRYPLIYHIARRPLSWLRRTLGF